METKAGLITGRLRKLLAKVTSGDMKEGIALADIGQFIQDLVRARITAGIAPKLAPGTLARKGQGKSTPLIDTGQLIGSITHEVRSGKR